MNAADSAVSFFEKGCSCSQSVFAPFAEQMGLDVETSMRIAAGFSGGIGHMGGLCGAVTGAYMALGLHFGGSTPKGKELACEKVCVFTKRFRQKHDDHVDCCDILGHDISTAEGKAEIKAQGLRNKICTPAVRTAAVIVEEMIAEYQS